MSLEAQMVRQVMAVLLYNRRFHRVSRPALDILASLFEQLLLQLWMRVGRVREFTAGGWSMEEVLRIAKPLYTEWRELIDFGSEQPQLEFASVLEERGLVSGQRILSGTRVDSRMVILEGEEAVMEE